VPRESLLQSFRCVVILDLPHSETVVSNDNTASQTDVSLRRSRAMILQCVLPQPTIQSFLSTVEIVEQMVATEFFNRTGVAHRARLESKNPGSSMRASRRCRGRGGALSAA